MVDQQRIVSSVHISESNSSLADSGLLQRGGDLGKREALPPALLNRALEKRRGDSHMCHSALARFLSRTRHHNPAMAIALCKYVGKRASHPPLEFALRALALSQHTAGLHSSTRIHFSFTLLHPGMRH